jgi:plastin-1
MTDDLGDDREERAFRMWINSLGSAPGSDQLYVQNLFGECRDGLALLRVIEHLRPGTVEWKRVEMKPNNR